MLSCMPAISEDLLTCFIVVQQPIHARLLAWQSNGRCDCMIILLAPKTDIGASALRMRSLDSIPLR